MEKIGNGYVRLYCKVGKKGQPVPEIRVLPMIDARGLVKSAPQLYSYTPFQEQIEEDKLEQVIIEPDDTTIEQVVDSVEIEDEVSEDVVKKANVSKKSPRAKRTDKK